nr:hypothetical protein GZ11A10_40 [uncultured archaeon GZfos11A10]
MYLFCMCLHGFGLLGYVIFVSDRLRHPRGSVFGFRTKYKNCGYHCSTDASLTRNRLSPRTCPDSEPPNREAECF